MRRTVHDVTPQLSKVDDIIAQGGMLLRIEADCLSVALITIHARTVSAQLFINSINKSFTRKNLEMRWWLSFEFFWNLHAATWGVKSGRWGR